MIVKASGYSVCCNFGKKMSHLCGVLFIFFMPLSSSWSADADWPCVQALVPSVELAVMWPEPVETETVEKWQQDKDISMLAGILSELDEYTERDRETVNQFSKGLSETDKTEKLGSLASITLALVNDRRSFYISGIKKYTVQQDAMASQVEKTLNKLETFSAASDNTEIATLEETLKWQQRIFDQREQAIRLLCEQPVVLEETLSAILRDLSQYLP